MKKPFQPNTGQHGENSESIDWAAVLDEHRGWLQTVVRSRLIEPDAVDDVMQEVAVAAIRQRSPIEDHRKVAPWLYRVAVRQVQLYRRKKGRTRKLVGRYRERLGPADAKPQAPDPLAWLISEERRELLRLALNNLPRRDAEILMLKYSGEWSYRQLAGHLGISLSAVEARLHRARRRLRSELISMEIFEVTP